MSINSIFAGSTPNSRDTYRLAYMNMLALDLANQTKNLNANKLFKANGTTGSAPPDTRSATEKYADLDGLKLQVRAGLKQITDGREAEDIVYELTTNEIEFLAGQLPAIIADLKPKWALGIPAGAFIPYFRKYMRKYIETEGVEYGVQSVNAGGGILATANNMVPRQELEDLEGELGDLAMSSQAWVKRSTKAKLNYVRGKLKELIAKRPTGEDREIMKEMTSVETLSDYDQIVGELSATIPSTASIIQMLREAIDARRNNSLEELDDMIYDMEDLLDSVDWKTLDQVYSATQHVKIALRRGTGELGAPKLKEKAFIDELYGAFRQGKPAYREEEIDPVEEMEPLRTPFGLRFPAYGTPVQFAREVLPQQEQSSMPDAYATPANPTRPINDPFEGDRFNGSEFLTAEEFQTLSPDEKRKLIIRYERDGGFEPYPELSPEIQKVVFGKNVDEDELDYLYGHYLVLTGNDTGNIDTIEPRGEAPQAMELTPADKMARLRAKLETQREPEDESGFGWSAQYPDPTVPPIMEEEFEITPKKASKAKAQYLEGIQRTGDLDIKEFKGLDRKTKQTIVVGLSGMVPQNVQFKIDTLKSSAHNNTLDYIYEQYLHYQPSALTSEALKAVPSSGGKKKASSSVETEQGSPYTTPEKSILASTDVLGRSPPIQKTLSEFVGVPEPPAQIQVHFPKKKQEFKDLSIKEQTKVLDRVYAQGVFEDNSLDEKKADEYMDYIRKNGFRLLTKVIAQEMYEFAMPAIAKMQAEGTIGFGLPTPHHLYGTHGYGLPHTLKTQQTMGGSLPKGKKKGNIIFGMGLSNVVSQPRARLSGKHIDLFGGVEPEPSYVKFGSHLINKHKLKDNIVMMRTPKGGAIVNIPTQKVSGKLAKVLHCISGGGIPQFESVMDLSDEDKTLLHRIAKTSKVSDRLSIPNPNKSKVEEEDNRFNILRGEIAIGQDNPTVIKEFKVLLLKFMREGRVPTGQGKALMEELLLLGY